MRLVLFGIWFFAMPVLAGSGINFWTAREGESFYASKSNTRSIQNLLKLVDGKTITDTFSDILDETQEKELCSFDINADLNQKIQAHSKKSINHEALILYLRQEKLIDDVVVKILLDADKVSSTQIRPKVEEEIAITKMTDDGKEILNLITIFQKRFLEKNCLDDAYKNFHSEVSKVNKNIKKSELEALLFHALKEKRINQDVYEILEKARLNELEKTTLGLKSYYSKIKSLRRNYPITRVEESNYVTSKVSKMSLSRRQKLLQNYTDLQIMMMGDVIRKLRKRLDTPKVEVLIYDRDPSGPTEVLEMTPMGRVRFLVNQVLQKDMEDLKLNKYFSGHQPEYLDLITASYEIGLIAGSEVDAIVGLEEMWNPKKTFWDKAGVWIQTFSSVATIVIPPPYGFIPALALVVMQATVGKDDPKTDGNYL